jgi:hypothetical protein
MSAAADADEDKSEEFVKLAEDVKRKNRQRKEESGADGGAGGEEKIN